MANPTTLNYDNQGNLTNIVFPDSTSLTYQYDLAGRMINAYDGASPPKSLQFGYNNQGLATNVIGAYGSLQKIIYDALNRPISVTDANGVTVTNTYDAINELLTRTWPDGIGEGFGYSTNGLIAYTNRDNQFTHYGLDNAGRITSVTNANKEFITIGYDSLDNVTSLIDGLLHQTTWQYNQYGWLTNKTDGLTRNAFRFAYNANGWLTNRWTPEKGNTGYSYDNVGNLKSITYPQTSISYAYDALNRLTNVVNGFFTNSFGYTPASQLAIEKGPWPNDTVSNSYSQLLRMSLNQLQPSGSWAQTSYGYDSVWRMQSLASPSGSFGYTFNGAASPLVSGITLPNTAWVTNTYDSLARLSYTALVNSSGHALDGYTYANDALGSRTNVTRDFGLMKSSAAAGYDKIGQITSWTGRETNGTLRLNEQLGYVYDPADNLHYRTNNALVQTFTVDAANELTGVGRTGTFTESGNTPAPAASVTVNKQAAQTYADFTFAAAGWTLNNGQNSFTNVAINPYALRATNLLTVNLPVSNTLLYDNNGNLTNDGMRSFAYDSENELTNVSAAGQWATAFVYDGLGRRRIVQDFAWQGGSWVKTNEVRYVYDGMLAVQERDSNNVVQVTYTRGSDLSSSIGGAGGIGGLLARTDGSGSTFYHADGAGNVTGLIDGNQYVVARYMYDPFGKLIGKWGSMADANVMRFSSMPYYRNAGIVGYWGRFYEPNLSRFTSQDPIGEMGGLNLYLFAGNSALNSVDPLGLYGWADFGDSELNALQTAKQFFTGKPGDMMPNDGYNGYRAGTGAFTPLKDANGNDVTTDVMFDLGTLPFMAVFMGPEREGGEMLAGGVKCEKAAKAAKAAEGTAPNLMYHYTTASESSFANGLWEGSSVTDKLYTDAAQASQELGIPVPNKVIPIQNTGQFVPNAPSIVQPSPLRGWSGGGSDFINPQRVPPSQLFPAQPIGPR
jgi:RHS repeat-associated protein